MLFWRRKRNKTSKSDWLPLLAPFSGKMMDLSDVPDPVFAQKMVGDGVAVLPESDLLLAPATGTLTHLFSTGHAAGITTDEGLEILIHIGINTVDLKGEGFTLLTTQGKRVEVGQPIIQIDREKIIKMGRSIITPVVITNMKQVEKIESAELSAVRAGADVLLRVLPKQTDQT